MRKRFGWILVCAWLALGCCTAGAWAAKKRARKAPAAKSSSQGKSAASSKKGAAKKRTAAKGSASKSSKRAAPKRATWRNRQSAPSPERYREIQQALAAKGFLQEEDATGVWGANSVDALKRFQQQQNLDAKGKINSLSLIALGLGPKREPLPPVAPAGAPTAQPVQQP